MKRGRTLSALGEAIRVREARARSEWEDDYAGAVEAALAGDPARLVDMLHARRPLTDDDFDQLTRFVSTKLRRRLWPDWLADAICKRPAGLDYDLLAGLVEKLGRRRGRVHDDLAHRTARLVDVLLFGRRVSAGMRGVIIAYALVTICNDETGEEPLSLVRRAESVLVKAPWPPVQRMASDEVGKVLRVEVTAGYVIVGEDTGTDSDRARVAGLFAQVCDLFNHSTARRHETR
jgi:hypothetical protein